MIANFTFSTARANDRNSLLGTLSCSGWLHSFWGFGGSLRPGFGVDRRVSVGFGSEFSGGLCLILKKSYKIDSSSQGGLGTSVVVVCWVRYVEGPREHR